MSAHRTTDPICSQYREPKGLLSRLAYERSRGKSCRVCREDNQRRLMHANLRAVFYEQALGIVVTGLQAELERRLWEGRSPAHLSGFQDAIKYAARIDFSGGPITPQTMQEP